MVLPASISSPGLPTLGTATLSHADSGSLQQNHLIHTGNGEMCVVLMVLSSKGKLRTPG